MGFKQVADCCGKPILWEDLHRDVGGQIAVRVRKMEGKKTGLEFGNGGVLSAYKTPRSIAKEVFKACSQDVHDGLGRCVNYLASVKKEKESCVFPLVVIMRAPR